MERELEIIKNMPSVGAASFFSIKVITLHMNYVLGTGSKVKVSIDGKHLTVEEAVAEVLNRAGYLIIRGDNVHIASFTLAGKYMTYVREYMCLNELDKVNARRLINQSNSLLKEYLSGKSEKLLPLLQNMEARLDFHPSDAALTDTSGFIKVFVDFMLSNPATAEAWIKCYNALPYDPRGVPDLFAWSSTTNRWFWTEVKSFNDSLRPEQWAWMGHFHEHTGHNTTVVRIVPYKYEEPSPAVSKYIAVNTSFHNGEPVFKSMPYQVSRILGELMKNSETAVMEKYKLSLEEINAAKQYALEQQETVKEDSNKLLDQMQ